MNSIKKTARIAGFFYLMFLVTSILADRFASIGFGDAAAIIDKIMSHERLFRTGFIIGLLSALFFLLAAWALYVLLKPVNENLALLFLLLNLVGVAIQCFSMLLLMGTQLVLAFLGYDIANVPRRPFHKMRRNLNNKQPLSGELDEK